MSNYSTSIEQYEESGRVLRLYRFSERPHEDEKTHDIVALSEQAARIQLQEILAGNDIECRIIDVTHATEKDLQKHVNRLSGNLEEELYHIERHEKLVQNKGR